MFKKITSLLLIFALFLVLPVMTGCVEKEVETRSEVIIDVEASSEPVPVIE